MRIQRMRFTANVGSQGDQSPLYIEELFPRREDTGMDRVTGYNCQLHGYSNSAS